MSNLYMTTTEFAALVVNALDEQNYFKKDAKAHPEDIATAFATVSETIGTAMSWAISKEKQVKDANKKAVMQTSTLSKSGGSATVTYTSNSISDDDYTLGYNEWKRKA